jgi:putative FmdB family regulatory protein
VPLYEYQCETCGRFEVIRKFSDEPLIACPTCGKEIQKLASAPAIQFKGTGWYVTDYAKKSSGGDSDGGKKAESSSKGEFKGDAKSGESKGESKGGESKGADSKKAAPTGGGGSSSSES